MADGEESQFAGTLVNHSLAGFVALQPVEENRVLGT